MAGLWRAVLAALAVTTAAAAGIAACAPASERPAAERPPPSDSEATVRAIFERGWNRGDFRDFPHVLADQPSFRRQLGALPQP